MFRSGNNSMRSEIVRRSHQTGVKSSSNFVHSLASSWNGLKVEWIETAVTHQILSQASNIPLVCYTINSGLDSPEPSKRATGIEQTPLCAVLYLT
jgi:hypothetical protein